MLGDRPLTAQRARALLIEMRARPLNFDPAAVGSPPRGGGWHVDDLAAPLALGSFERARDAMRRYEVADPALVRAFYDERDPLEGRTMVLELRLRRLRFVVGVRVGAAYDERRDVDGRAVRVGGWNYRTLEGHLEMGQLAWEVWKWEDTGAVEFHIHAFSRPAPTDDLVVGLGYRLVGRRQQLRFYRRACARMAALTADHPGSPPARCR
jgi:uncharacterized protein (UPF0548 family)